MVSPRAHASLAAQGVGAWLAFWLLGLPWDYYRELPAPVLGAGSVLISAGLSLAVTWALARAPAERRSALALAMAFWFTAPLAALDTAYCAIWRGHGAGYLVDYWYLSIFYVTPWLTFPATARVLAGVRR